MTLPSDSTEWTARQLRDQLIGGATTAEAATKAYLSRIQAFDDKIGSYLSVCAYEALAHACDIDRRRQRNQPLGSLAGVPIAMKDLLCVRGMPTSAGSRILQGFHPPYDATVVSKLRAADAILLGKTNLDEFGMGSSTENSAFKPTRNPYDLERSPGGSSGGSAAAVAARLAPWALGTDTGGSIRQPASFCGVVGLKPTYGLLSRYGLIAYASSLDQIGPLTRDVADAALLLEVLAGHDPKDSTSVEAPIPSYSAMLEQKAGPWRVGVPREFFESGLDAEVEASVKSALARLRGRGCELVEISLPTTKHAIAAYYLVAMAEASSNLARFDGVHYGHRAAQSDGLSDMMSRTRGEGFGAEVKRRILLGTYALSKGYKDALYVKALQVRRLIKGDFDRAFERCDIIAGPTAPTPAFRLGERLADPVAMYLSDIYTINANLTGLPAISVPCGATKAGLPIGLQLHAPAFREGTLLQAASWVAADFELPQAAEDGSWKSP